MDYNYYYYNPDVLEDDEVIDSDAVHSDGSGSTTETEDIAPIPKGVHTPRHKSKKSRKSSTHSKSTETKPRRTKHVKRDIEQYHNRVKPIVRRRLVRECAIHTIPEEYSKSISPAAVSLLHETVEAYVVDLLREANLVALNRGDVTVQSKDLDLARRIHGEGHTGSAIFT